MSENKQNKTTKWYQVKFSSFDILHETDKSYLISMPQASNYRDFRLWAPKNLIKNANSSGTEKYFSFPETFEFRLKRYNGEQIVEEAKLNAYDLATLGFLEVLDLEQKSEAKVETKTEEIEETETKSTDLDDKSKRELLAKIKEEFDWFTHLVEQIWIIDGKHNPIQQEVILKYLKVAEDKFTKFIQDGNEKDALETATPEILLENFLDEARDEVALNFVSDKRNQKGELAVKYFAYRNEQYFHNPKTDITVFKTSNTDGLYWDEFINETLFNLIISDIDNYRTMLLGLTNENETLVKIFAKRLFQAPEPMRKKNRDADDRAL